MWEEAAAVEKEDSTRIMSKASFTDALVTLLCLLMFSLVVYDEGGDR